MNEQICFIFINTGIEIKNVSEQVSSHFEASGHGGFVATMYFYT